MRRVSKLANATADDTRRPNTVTGASEVNRPTLQLVLEKKIPVVLLLFRKHTQQFIGMKEKGKTE